MLSRFNRMFTYFFLITVALLASGEALCEKPKKVAPVEIVNDPRGPPELTICSQNLNNFGTFAQSKARLYGLTTDDYAQKIEAVAKRIVRAKCDIIGVQELLAKDVDEGKATLSPLITRLRQLTGRLFEPYIGQSNEPLSREAFLIAKDRAEVQNILSYHRVELPKIMPRERPRFFIRGPLELQLLVQGKGDASAKVVSIINFHFKSKAGKGRDPAELEFETYRMQMAEGLRRVIENRHAQSFASGETILVVLGDRNSNYDAASAEILEGRLALNQFQGEATCRLTKRGVALCKKEVNLPQRLFSVLTQDPEAKLFPGTFLFENTYSWLDDILMPSESLRFAWERFDSEGNYAAGVISEPKAASDHSMVYTQLNW